MRTQQEKEATRLRKAAERAAHRARVFAQHPPQVRYANAKFKTGKKRQKASKKITLKLGVQ